MMKILQSTDGKGIKANSALVFLAGLFIFLIQIPSYYGEDIVNARNNLLTGSRTDFWGGVSTLIYGNIPDIVVRWQIWLALFQVLITTLSLIALFNEHKFGRIRKFIEWILIYISLVFASQMTRDGLMFSIIISSFALLKISHNSKYPRLLLLSGLASLVFGMSFRPWLSLAAIPIAFAVASFSGWNLKRFYAIWISIGLVVTPLLIEQSAATALELNQSYPQQQVMIMDAASTYCFTNNYQTSLKAREILQLFTNDLSFPDRACQFFRTDTWLSLTNSGTASSQNLKSDFWLIPAGNETKYTKLQNDWLQLLIKDPISYLQNKSVFFTKLAIASDSRSLSISRAETAQEKISGAVRAPYELLIGLHFFSVAVTVILLFYIPAWNLFKRKTNALILEKFTLSVLSSILLWTLLSSIAYIGSNGRYTYTITIIALVLLVSCQPRLIHLRKTNE
ncbi:hypothetical protein MCEMRE185_00059 [Candidatus Nanopelagicaceae bacterium]